MPANPPDRADLRKCRSCGAAIFFAVTAVKGRPVPLDALPEKRYVLRWEGDRPTPGYVATLTDVFTTHFVTCPNADSHRKKR